MQKITTLTTHNEPLGEQILNLYAQINLANYHLLNLIFQFDESKLYAKEGCRSTAHWLTYRCGIGPAAARRAGAEWR